MPNDAASWDVMFLSWGMVIRTLSSFPKELPRVFLPFVGFSFDRSGTEVFLTWKLCVCSIMAFKCCE